MGERIVYQAEDGSYVRISDSGTTIGYRAEGDTSHGDLVADCIRHLTARAERAEAERDALRARRVVHPDAMRWLVAWSEAEQAKLFATSQEVLRRAIDARAETSSAWREGGAPVWAPPIDPVDATTHPCPACGSWVGVAPAEVDDG